MNRRGFDYKVIKPNSPCRCVLTLPPETATVLSRIQDREQKRRDHKIGVHTLVTDIILGRVKVDNV